MWDPEGLCMSGLETGRPGHGCFISCPGHPPPMLLSPAGADGECLSEDMSTHPLVVHVGQDPSHQLNKEDHQQQAEILEQGEKVVTIGMGPGWASMTKVSPEQWGEASPAPLHPLLFPAALGMPASPGCRHGAPTHPFTHWSAFSLLIHPPSQYLLNTCYMPGITSQSGIALKAVVGGGTGK